MKGIGGKHRVSVTLGVLLCALCIPPSGHGNSQVIAWGGSYSDQTKVPLDLTNATSVAAAGWYSLALLADGTAVGWGDNRFGQTEVPAGDSDIVAAAGGLYHCYALRADGTVTGWGRSAEGQIDIPESLSNVVSIASGEYHGLALRNDGTVVTWGKMRSGNSYVPATIPSGLSNVVAIAGAYYRNMALRSDGTVVVWGGRGSQRIPSNVTNVVAMAGGRHQNVIVNSSGQVLLWEGDAGASEAYAPPGLTNIVAIAADGDRGLALKSDGAVVAWESIEGGAQFIPDFVPAGLSNVCSIATGFAHYLALVGEHPVSLTTQEIEVAVPAWSRLSLPARAAGSPPLSYQWQWEGSGIPGATNMLLSVPHMEPYQAGTYSVAVRNPFGASTGIVARVTVLPPSLTVQPNNQAIYLGADVTITVSVPETAPVQYQWQHNGADLPGETNLTLNLPSIRRDQEGVYRVVVSNVYGSIPSEPVEVAVSSVAAWGPGSLGQARVPSDLDDVVSISAGGWHSLALTRSGHIRSWGGQADPVEPHALRNITAISAGGGQSLALHDTGQVATWGGDAHVTHPLHWTNASAIFSTRYNDYALTADGILLPSGTNGTGKDFVPTRITNVVAVAGGLGGVAALKADGTVDTWGGGSSGFDSVPIDLSNVVAIACGLFHGLALRADGTVRAWGSQITQEGSVPAQAPAGLSDVIAVAASSQNNMALKKDGTVVAWGGFNGTDYVPAYVPPGLAGVTAISAGDTYSLALSGEGPPTIHFPNVNRSILGGRNATFYAPATGAWPLHYQWRHAGTNLPGATGPSLLISDLQASDAGSYSVVVSNEVGSATSSECQLTIEPCHASLLESNVVTFPGGSAFLIGVLRGNEADAYQWRFAGEDIPGANSISLSLTNVEFMQAGDYTLVVSNRYGVVETQPCRLNVVPVAAWGKNSGNALDIPATLTNVVKVAAGSSFSVALSADGTVACWGSPYYGITNVPPDLTNVIDIAAATSHALALKRDGTVRAWGVQSYALANSLVPANLSNVVSISAAAKHNLACRADGTVVAWGTSHYGVTNVPPTLTDAVAVAAGAAHSSALQADGTVVCWGSNGSGQTDVPPDLRSVVAIAAGDQFTLALTANGSLAAWGRINNQPATIPAGLSNVVAISAGANHCYALRQDGTLLGWGNADDERASTPAEVRDVVDVDSGFVHNLAIIGHGPPRVRRPAMSFTVQDGGTLMLRVQPAGRPPFTYQWRLNGADLPAATSPFLALTNLHPTQAGIYSVLISNEWGVTVTTNAIVEVDSLRFIRQPSDSVAQIAATHVFEVLAEGLAPISYQWQFNGSDIPGATSNVLALKDVSLDLAGVYRVRASGPYSYRFSEPASLAVIPIIAWGNNDAGQTSVPLSASNAVAIAAGRDFSLALKADGTVAGWGDSHFGQCTPPAGLTNCVAITAGGQHALALTGERTVVAWGRNLEQQCDVPYYLSNSVAIAAGASHSLALQANGIVVAWGANDHGQANVPADLRAVSIACGDNHSLAISDEGSVVAWGDNTYRQGDVPPGVANAISICAGLAHSVAVLADGRIVAWGNNVNWQLDVPNGLTNVFRVTAGALHNLALTSGRMVVPWGWNLQGQTNMPTDLENCIGIAAGRAHSLALLADTPRPIQAQLTTGAFTREHFELEFLSEHGRVYRLEHSDRLDASGTNWHRLPLLLGNGSSIDVFDLNPTETQRYYRLRQW